MVQEGHRAGGGAGDQGLDEGQIGWVAAGTEHAVLLDCGVETRAR